MVELQDEYESRGLVVIGIDVDEEPEVVRSFVEERGINYINLLGDVKVFRDYRLTAHPQTVLIAPRGEIHNVYIGTVSKEILEKDIETLLSAG